MMSWRLLGKGALALAPVAAALVLMASSNPLVVRILDFCDPATFNAAFGPGVCVGNGQTTVEHFLKELTAAQKVGSWNFNPANGTVAPGTLLSLENRGGETHTFTKVQEFGGGFIPPLNTLSGTPVPAPECATVTQGGLVPKPPSPSNIFIAAGETGTGPTAGSAIMPSGTTTKFQCCIHPWMRNELRTK